MPSIFMKENKLEAPRSHGLEPAMCKSERWKRVVCAGEVIRPLP
jgi:hypothetical protein